jgi:hypothetical protein
LPMPSIENQMSVRARAVRIACAVSCLIAVAALAGCNCPPPSEIDQGVPARRHGRLPGDRRRRRRYPCGRVSPALRRLHGRRGRLPPERRLPRCLPMRLCA